MKLLDRRTFMKEVAQVGAAVYLGSIQSLSCNSNPIPAKVKVGLIRSPAVWNDNRLDQSIIHKMLDRGIMAVTGYDSPSKAWNSLFIKKDIVALKVNCKAGLRGSTRPELSYAVAEGLHYYVGIPPENVIIFDNHEKELSFGGYQINRSGKGIQIYNNPGYSSLIRSGNICTGVSTVITDKCTALINLPLLKTHAGAGLTLCLKNHYGSIPREIVQDDRLGFHSKGYKNIIDVNCLQPIREKTRLCIADSFVAQFDMGPRGTPQYQWKYSGIIMGMDPVAVDTVGLQIINDKRREKSLPLINVDYLKWAEGQGLGKHHHGSIELLEETA